MGLPFLPFSRLITSRQLISGQHINSLTDLLTGTTASVIAFAGGGQAGATLLTSAFNEIATVANAADSLALPIAKSGMRIAITNLAANAPQIWVANGSSDVIRPNGATVTNVVGPAQNITHLFVCYKDGVWTRFISA